MTTTEKIMTNEELLKKNTDRREDPNGTRVFVVGDILGNIYALRRMLTKIEMFERAKNDKVVFLGNYVGEGNHSRECLELVRRYKSAAPDNVVLLKGCNEYLMWRGFKGLGVQSKAIRNSYAEDRVITNYLVKQTTKRVNTTKLYEDKAFINYLPFKYSFDDLLFTNSGVDINKDTIEELSEGACLFTRGVTMEKYQDKIEDKLLVHGNIPTSNGEIDIRKNRVNVCTTKSGILSGIVIKIPKNNMDEQPEIEEELRVPIF